MAGPYYVRTPANGGSDAADGLSAGAAFATIDKAANTVVANTIVYVGAGVYRELVTMDTSGTSGNLIQYIADVDGSKTGDAGMVIISAHANETSAPSAAACVDMNGKQYITWRGFTMTGGTTATIDLTGTGGKEEVIIEDCVLLSSNITIWVDTAAGATATTGLIVRRCVLSGRGIYWVYDEDATDRDLNATIENCVFEPHSQSTSTANASFTFNRGTTSTGGVGGITIYNCTFLGMDIGVCVNNTAATNTNIIDVQNCVFIENRYGMWSDTAGKMTSDYNEFKKVANEYVAVTPGANDVASDTTDSGLLGGLHDMTLYWALGWSPYLPFEPIRLQDDSYTNSGIGVASATPAPATDFYGNPRPMHGTVDDIGAVEGRARPEQETTTVRTGANAGRFDGAGYHDFLIPVLAQSTTVSIYGQFDANYTGSKPKLDVFNIPGVADQSDIMTGSSGAWEELTATFTPDEAGVARVRISSQDTSATGEAFFDDLTVT